MFKNKLIYLSAAEELGESLFDDGRKYLNSATAGRDASWNKTIRDVLIKGVELFDPIVTYGIGIMIVVCALIFFCSKDRKATARGIKGFILYVIWCFLRGELLCQ